MARAGGFNFAGFRFRYGVVFTTTTTTQQAAAHHQPDLQPEPASTPEQAEASVEAAEEATEVENEASGLGATSGNRAEASHLEEEEEEIEGAYGDHDLSAELVEDVAKDLREVSEALRPFLASAAEEIEPENESTEEG